MNKIMNYLVKNPSAGEFLEYLKQGEFIFVMLDHGNYFKLPEVRVGKNSFNTELLSEFEKGVQVVKTLDELVKLKILVKSESDAPDQYGLCEVYHYANSTSSH